MMLVCVFNVSLRAGQVRYVALVLFLDSTVESWSLAYESLSKSPWICQCVFSFQFSFSRKSVSYNLTNFHKTIGVAVTRASKPKLMCSSHVSALRC